MEILMVHSYKGGSGKTLLSYNLALTLSKQKQRALLIEGDLDGPVFHNNFPDLSPTRYINQYLKDPKDLDSYIVKNGSFDLIFASPDFASEDLMRNRDYESLLENIIKIKEQINSLPYDYVIIDLSPGVNYLAVASILLANRVLLVLRPDQNSFEGTKLLINKIYANTTQTQEKEFHIIINQVPDIPEFNEIISEWQIVMKYDFSILTSFHTIPFSAQSNLSVLKKQVLLDPEDPIVTELLAIIKYF